jgi:ActR/RegA family two-component response regulator
VFSLAMAAPCVIVCEKSSRWAVALRWVLAGSGVRVCETRSLADCWSALESAPTSPVALELRRTNAAEIVHALQRMRARVPETAAIVLLERGLSAWEWTAREAGALHVSASPRNLDPVARLLQRLLRSAAPAETSLRETLLARLPWEPRGSQA